MKQESTLKSRFLAELRLFPGFVIIRHEDVRTSGIPDLSLTGYGKDSWIEIKHGTPDFQSEGIQELTMLRLAGAGYARYLIYREDKNGQSKKTMIVHPTHIKDLEAEAWCIGHNHKWAAEFFRKRHQL